MDPRFTSVALSAVGMELRCEACRTVIETNEFPGNEGWSIFEIVRASLRHECEVEEVPNAVEGD